MIDAGRIGRHACSAIRRSSVEGEPFPHLLIEELLPPEVHDALVAVLPPIERYLRPEQTHSAGERAILPAAARPSQPEALEPVLGCVNAALCATTFVDELLMKLGIAGTAAPDSGLPPDVQLFLARDVPPYAIGPHTDVPARLASGVLYLAPADAPPEWGTTLFVPEDGLQGCAEGRHYGFDGFRAARTVPFSPNRALVFCRTDRSFHGLLPLLADCRTRDVLLFEIVRAGVVRRQRAP
jgi:hypothetical protein